MLLTQEQLAALDRLDSALCNFINGVNDEYDPRLWIAETKEHFVQLSKCYNECHVLEVLDLREARERNEE